METFQKIALIFTIIGALNWGLIGLLNFNLVDTLFGSIPLIKSIIYIVVGICGLINCWLFFMHFRDIEA